MEQENSNRRRITVRIEDEELHRKIQEYIPWGTMKPLINTIMADVVSLMEKHDSRLILGAILSKDIVLADYLNKIEKLDDVKYSRPKKQHNRSGEEPGS